jgi:hypothetical protein
LKVRWFFLGIVLALGCMAAIGFLVFWFAVEDSSRIVAIPTPTACVPQESARITCTLSASKTRVKVGDIVSLTMDISNPDGSCNRIGWFTYSLTQSPQLFTAEHYLDTEHKLSSQLVHRSSGSFRETIDVKAIEAGHGLIKGAIDFEVWGVDARTFAWSGCDAGTVDILVEP